MHARHGRGCHFLTLPFAFCPAPQFHPSIYSCRPVSKEYSDVLTLTDATTLLVDSSIPMEPAPGPRSVQATAAISPIHRPTSNSGTSEGERGSGTSSSSSSSSSSSINSGPGLRRTASTSIGTSSSDFIRELESISARSRQVLQQQTASTPQPSPSNTITSSTDSSGPYQEPSRCYICFGTEEDSVGRWVKPCQCTLISHEDCLLDWIDKNRQQFARKQASGLQRLIFVFGRLWEHTVCVFSFCRLTELYRLGLASYCAVLFPPHTTPFALTRSGARFAIRSTDWQSQTRPSSISIRHWTRLSKPASLTLHSWA